MTASAASGNIEDLRDERVPPCLQWSYEQVADWIEELGFPMYRDCFLSNKINGRRLILMEASALPDIGIKDFQHIKLISKKIRESLLIEEPFWNKSISLPPRESLGMYLERKCVTGERADDLSYEVFLRDQSEAKWQPPLSNHCLILPSD